MEKQIIIYTDGACLGNPGKGGYGAILIWGDKRKELSQGYRLTTNNRMELSAAIAALKLIKQPNKHPIILHSDSRLLVDAVNKDWLTKWKAKSWMRTNKDKVINPDLWAQIYDLIQQLNVEFKWVPAHVGIPDNERCDELSKNAAMSDELLIDDEYEKSIGNDMYLKLL